MADLRDDVVDIPFITSEFFLEDLGTGPFYDDGVTAIGGITPGTGSIGIAGELATIQQTFDALIVLFDIWSTIYSPLYVQFDIGAVPFVVNPLLVEFDIVVEDGVPLIVTFDIFVEALINARLYNDIQGPVAEVDLS